MSMRLAHTFTHGLLGPPGRQRLRVSQTLLSLLVFLVFAAVQQAEVVMGLIDVVESAWLTGFNLAGALLFYGLIRSGLNEKISAEPALTEPQMVFGLVSVAWAYGISGPARGAVMSIMLLILMFGMFVLDGQASRRLALFGFGLLVAVMLWKSRTDPQNYDLRVEAVHLAFAAIVLASVTVLSVRMGRLRQRLRGQKAELSEALMRIQALATRDSLTGLLNRRAMMDELRAEARRAERLGQPLSLALVDMDHFKSINDSLGHGVGDRVLQHFAEVAREELRDTDRLARWGGEEFLLLLPQSTVVQATATLERIRARLREMAIDGVSRELAITFSAGVARCASDTEVEAAVELADVAMYRAKTGGRNRTEYAPVVSRRSVSDMV